MSAPLLACTSAFRDALRGYVYATPAKHLTPCTKCGEDIGWDDDPRPALCMDCFLDSCTILPNAPPDEAAAAALERILGLDLGDEPTEEDEAAVATIRAELARLAQYDAAAAAEAAQVPADVEKHGPKKIGRAHAAMDTLRWVAEDPETHGVSDWNMTLADIAAVLPPLPEERP